jgi:hypothetical protein
MSRYDVRYSLCTSTVTGTERHRILFPTVFRRGRSNSDSIAESSPYQKKRPRLVPPLEDMPTVREIIHDVVDKEKQSIRPSPHD